MWGGGDWGDGGKGKKNFFFFGGFSMIGMYIHIIHVIRNYIVSGLMIGGNNNKKFLLDFVEKN